MLLAEIVTKAHPATRLGDIHSVLYRRNSKNLIARKMWDIFLEAFLENSFCQKALASIESVLFKYALKIIHCLVAITKFSYQH